MPHVESFLQYRAGPRALRRIAREGLRPEAVRAFAGTASGPRWLALAGLDRALIETGFAAAPAGAPRRLLVGASAGAWRALAFASDRPAATHERLVRGYIAQAFPRRVRPATVTEAYRRMLADVFPDDTVARILANPSNDVAVHVVRWRGPWPWRSRALQMAAMVAVSGLRRVGVRATGALIERVLVHARPEALGARFDGVVVPMRPGNARAAALASGAVPIYVEPVLDIAGAPSGAYSDGGIGDYHLRQSWIAGDDGVVLLPHFQEAILGEWFDRFEAGAGPPAGVLNDLVQVFPSQRWVDTLPGGRLPDRDDFFRFVDAPDERMRRWNEAVARSEELGEAFLRDVASGDLAARVRPIAG
jgi:hypothetical protein